MKTEPRLAKRLLELFVYGEAREVIIGDLREELLSEILPRHGTVFARRWYWRQVLKSIVATRWARDTDFASDTIRSGSREGIGAALIFEVRSAWFRIRRRGLPSLGAIATLGLGIGAAVTLWTIVDTVLIKPLAIDNEEKLVSIGALDRRDTEPGPISLPNFEDLRSESSAFADFAAVDGNQSVLIDGSRSEKIAAAWVSASFFRMIGAQAQIGRLFESDDESTDPARYRQVILTDDFWRTRFGADPKIVGTTISLSGYPNTVIGVLTPESQTLAIPIESSNPVAFRPWPHSSTEWPRSGRSMQALAQIASTSDLATARAEIEVLGLRLAARHPEDNAGRRWQLTPIRERLVGGFRLPLLSMFGAVVIILMVTCTNVGGLILNRTLASRSELLLRSALGANRRRVIGQVFTESALLTALGGAVGLAVASVALVSIRTFGNLQLPRLDALQVDVHTVSLAAIAALFATIFTTAAPTIYAARLDPRQGGLDHSRSPSMAGPRGRRTFALLVTAQISLAVALVTVSGLFVRSLGQLSSVDMGIDSRQTVAADILPLSSKYQGPEALKQLYQRINSVISQTPTVSAAGTTSILPLSDNYSCDGFFADDRPEPAYDEQDCAETRIVSGQVFAALETPLIAGRVFDARDAADSSPVVIVNQALANAYWPQQSALGKRLTSVHGDVSRQIVGIVGDIHHFGPQQAAPKQLFIPLEQELFHGWGQSQHTLVVRFEAAAGSRQVATILAQLERLDPDLPVQPVGSLASLEAQAISQETFRTRLLSSFAAIALFLSAMGLYSILSQGVIQRRQEIGIRRAIGATGAAIAKLILRQGLRLTLIGLVIGLSMSMIAARFLQSLLFGITPADPVTLFGVVGVSLLVSIAALALPCIEANKIRPVAVLRESR